MSNELFIVNYLDATSVRILLLICLNHKETFQLALKTTTELINTNS